MVTGEAPDGGSELSGGGERDSGGAGSSGSSVLLERLATNVPPVTGWRTERRRQASVLGSWESSVIENCSETLCFETSN